MKIHQKRPGLPKKKVVLHQDAQKAYLKSLKCELLQHPPNSPDSVHLDFWLFSLLKQFLGGYRFSSNEEMIAAVNG